MSRKEVQTGTKSGEPQSRAVFCRASGEKWINRAIHNETKKLCEMYLCKQVCINRMTNCVDSARFVSTGHGKSK